MVPGEILSPISGHLSPTTLQDVPSVSTLHRGPIEPSQGLEHHSSCMDE